MEWEYVVVELKLIEESGLATCFGLSEVLIKWAKFGVKPQFGSVGVVGSFLVTEKRKKIIDQCFYIPIIYNMEDSSNSTINWMIW